MQKMIIYGSSDDLIEIAGVKGGDEFYAEGSGPLVGQFNLGGLMRVYAIYDGCWAFAIGKVDEDIEIPRWPVTISPSPENDYSMQLTVEVPDSVKIFRERINEK